MNNLVLVLQFFCISVSYYVKTNRSNDNDNGKYDPKQVEDLMKECYNNKETTWQPSSTVLTASELAPVVPDDVKNMLK